MSAPASRWSPTRIRWSDRTLETSTGASRVETDQGSAYAKLLGNPEGPHALFCDWVGTQAAAWLGLPTFEVAVVEVTEAGIVTYSNGTLSQMGPAFVARAESRWSFRNPAAHRRRHQVPHQGRHRS